VAGAAALALAALDSRDDADGADSQEAHKEATGTGGLGAQAEAAGVGGYGRRHHHLDVLGPRRLTRATGSVARRTRGTAGSPGRSASSTSAAAQPSSPNPAIRDLPPPVSPISIPRAHTFSFLLSVDFSAHPTDSPPAAPPRRRLPPVAAVALRAAPPLQLPSARAPGELCPVPDHVVRAPGHRRCTGARRGEGGTGEGGREAPPHELGRGRGGAVRTWMEREGMSG